MARNEKVLAIVGGFYRLHAYGGDKQGVECLRGLVQEFSVVRWGISVANIYVPTELACHHLP